ncbi:polynucleotide kinase 3 phosphatase-domain-containing protein [Radiomyces spectabilis]|uniref:polynucleotide kinase 3 phosphatase-domain-containing protein n=1 Tax=Radiomyces spectabilis TaxID=64574 RepID=UPI00221F4515|nr:polynucleotide kinase 3 phosphatase-domain-containing protein [Radiomyces spectabilis]KAI8384401.1 polynucleotide kinase 3 phosphatase-domain-containing protein [Radiomyces spectabilis]
MKQTVKWLSSIESVLIAKTVDKEVGRHKVAAFDLDATLISTKTGRVHSKDENDWQWWHSSVPSQIKKLHDDGYKIVVFSNQNGLNSPTRIQSFKRKVEAILSQLSMPVWLLAAMNKDQYRKPMVAMWNWLEKQANDGVKIEQSFYVGDAAGRADNWKPRQKRDHSCTDRKFADNIGIGFYTPEEFFLKEPKAAFSWGGFIPSESTQNEMLFTPSSSPLVLKDEPEVIVFVGYPASGKSTFAEKYLIPHGYVYVNQDTLKTRNKCIAACKDALAKHQSVVIDNTNPEIATRASYIQVARDAGAKVRCFYFTADEHLARHNNYYRAIQKPHENRELLSDIAFRTFKSRLQIPTEAEGFDEVKKINFIFEGSEEEQRTWKQWWL